MAGAPPAAAPQHTSPITELGIFQEGQNDPAFQWLAPRIGDAVYLGFKKTEGGEPITEMKVGYDDQDFAPEGFAKATGDLNPLGTKRVFIWVKKGGDASSIIHIKIMTSDEQFAGAGYVKLNPVLNPAKSGGRAPRLNLCYKTLEAHRKHEERNWAVGDKIDALDTSQSCWSLRSKKSAAKVIMWNFILTMLDGIIAGMNGFIELILVCNR
jgi:hypothetical protein